LFIRSFIVDVRAGFHEHRERAHTQIQVLVSATIKRLYSEGDASFYRFLDGIRVAEAVDMWKRAHALLEQTLHTPSFVTTENATASSASSAAAAAGASSDGSAGTSSSSSSLRTTSYATDVALQHAIQHHLQLMRGVIPQSQHAKRQLESTRTRTRHTHTHTFRISDVDVFHQPSLG